MLKWYKLVKNSTAVVRYVMSLQGQESVAVVQTADWSSWVVDGQEL